MLRDLLSTGRVGQVDARAVECISQGMDNILYWALLQGKISQKKMRGKRIDGCK